MSDHSGTDVRGSAGAIEPRAPVATASWLQRALAYALDMHISMIFLVLAYLGSKVVSAHVNGAGAVWATWALYVAWFSVGFYNRCIVMGRTGCSLGRRVTNTSLIRESTGKPIGITKAFLRENLHFLDTLMLGVGYFLPIWDPKGQTMADRLMRTLTVKGRVPNRPPVLSGVHPSAERPALAGVRAGRLDL